MTLPPGLDDASTRRHLIAAIQAWQREYHRNGRDTPAGLETFCAWLDGVTEAQRDAIPRRRALSRQRSARYRQRQRERRQAAGSPAA
jgi:hypothetical protein